MSEVSYRPSQRFQLTCSALRGDGAELDANSVAGVLEVLQRVAVSARAAPLLATAVGKATGKAEPEVLLEVALGALGGNCSG